MKATLVVLCLALSGCVGAFMLDAGGARGGSSRVTYPRAAELTTSERAAGCTMTDWYASFRGTPTYVLWTVLDPSGKPTGVNAGGLIEVRCPAPGTVGRFCVYGTPPVKKGIYDKTGLLIGCQR
jgi:hypothetical protein